MNIFKSLLICVVLAGCTSNPVTSNNQTQSQQKKYTVRYGSSSQTKTLILTDNGYFIAICTGGIGGRVYANYGDTICWQYADDQGCDSPNPFIVRSDTSIYY